MNDLEDRIATLEGRLHDGFSKIGQKLNEGVKVENWTNHWIDLLREYEALSDDLAAMRPEQVELGGMPRKEAA